MNIATAAEALLKGLGEADNAVQHGPALLALVTEGVHDAERTLATGDDKLTDVLNRSEVFLNEFVPEAMAALEAIIKAVRDFVNALVALYNKTGAFIHGVEAALGNR